MLNPELDCRGPEILSSLVTISSHYRKELGSVFLALIILAFTKKMRCCRGDELIIGTRNGLIRGSEMKSKQGKKIFAFRGIPYAKPPVGDRRFRRSEPAEPWCGVRDGTSEARKSYQPNVLMPGSPFRDGGEDCLYLNVYTKRFEREGDGPVEAEEPRALPVIVFLHGGAFVVGSCESLLYGPQVLLDKELVLVGVNYRLGALGFLSLETDEAPGNLGLHDQFLALTWVRDNILQFGGDPGNVTLMGESAGAMSAFCHLVSPASAGLFHRVIALSGTWTNALMHNDRRPRTYALTLALKLGYSGDREDSDKLLTFLQSLSARKIIKASVMFMDWDYAFPMPWVPVVDKYAQNPFLPDKFSVLVEDGKFNKVPVMVGLCQDEGYIMTAPYYKDRKRWELLTRQWDMWAPLLFLGRERELINDSDRDAVGDIARFYFGENNNMAELPRTEENLRLLGRIYSMAYFFSGADHDTKLLKKAGAEVYNFVLSQPPNFTLMDLFRLSFPQMIYMFSARAFGRNPYPPVQGVCHGDDLIYLFPMTPFPDTIVTDNQKRVRQQLLDIVSSFSGTSVPTFADAHDGLAQPLPPLSLELGLTQFFDLGASPASRADPDMKRELDLWHGVLTKAGQVSRDLEDRLPETLHNKIACQR